MRVLTDGLLFESGQRDRQGRGRPAAEQDRRHPRDREARIPSGSRVTPTTSRSAAAYPSNWELALRPRLGRRARAARHAAQGARRSRPSAAPTSTRSRATRPSRGGQEPPRRDHPSAPERGAGAADPGRGRRGHPSRPRTIDRHGGHSMTKKKLVDRPRRRARGARGRLQVRVRQGGAEEGSPRSTARSTSSARTSSSTSPTATTPSSAWRSSSTTARPPPRAAAVTARRPRSRRRATAPGRRRPPCATSSPTP